MALEKTITTTYGIDVTYWRIARVIYNVDTASVEMLIHGYPSKSTRDLGAQPLYTISHTAAAADVMADTEPTRALMYGWMKTLNTFEGATDILEVATEEPVEEKAE